MAAEAQIEIAEPLGFGLDLCAVAERMSTVKSVSSGLVQRLRKGAR